MPQNDPIRVEITIYTKAAEARVLHAGNPQRMSPAQIVKLAADGAVEADRSRMAAALRERVMHTTLIGLPPDLSMKVEEIMFLLADQIAVGMPFDPKIPE